MQSKEYKLSNGKTAIFEYDVCGIGKITLECMDELIAMIEDRLQGDFVSRQYLLAEIDDLADEFSETDENGLYSERWCGIMDAKRVIMNTPSVSDIPQGEWIDKGWKGDWQFETDGRGNCWYEYECSECGFRNKEGKSNYCPNCGIKMKGADDETD